MPEIPATPPDDQKRSRFAKLLRPKVAIPVFLLVVLILSPFISHGWHLRGVPDVPEPFDTASLLSLEISDEENAFTEYRQATALYVQPSLHVRSLRDGETDQFPLGINTDGWHLADDEVRQFLKDNEPAINLWKLGSEKDQALYISPSDIDDDTLLPVMDTLFEMRETGLLLGRKLEAERKHEDAWNWYRMLIRSSRHFGTNGGVIERHAGERLFRDVADRIEEWAASPSVSGKRLQQCLLDLQEDWKLTEKTSTVSKIQYLCNRNTLTRLQAGTIDLKWSYFADQSKSSLPLNNFTLYLHGEPELGIRLSNLQYYNGLQFCDLLPYQRTFTTEDGYLLPASSPDDKQTREVLSVDEFDKLCDRSLIANKMLYWFGNTQWEFHADESRFRCLLVTLAGQHFYRVNGNFPKNLDDLVPKYLEEIPIDIYDGEPLKYVHLPEGPVVYSVFENLRDDGGTDLKSRNGKYFGYIEPLDLGFQMRIPGIKPLRADKPLIVEDDDSE